MARMIPDNVRATLARAAGTGDTSIYVRTGDGAQFEQDGVLSASNYVIATLVKVSGFRDIAWERVKVTARSTDTLTVTRSYGGDTALSFSAGDRIEVRVDSSALTPPDKANTFSEPQTFSGGVSLGSQFGNRNILINGAFGINQRAPASNADDTYAHDRWYALTQTGAIAVSTVSDAENGTPYMARLTQSQASAQRMGYAQIVESANCKHLRGKQVTFRFGRVRLSSSANIRVAILEWTGTADTVTSDVVLDWTSGTYTAGNFFLASNLTVSAVDQQALTANTLTDGDSVTVTLGSSFNNLIVLVWTEGTVAQNVTLDLALAQLEPGPIATAFEWRQNEQQYCYRYYYRLFPAVAGVPLSIGGFCNNTTQLAGFYPFPVTMRRYPTALEQSGTATDYAVFVPGAVIQCSAVPTFNAASKYSATVYFTVAAGLTTGQSGVHRTDAGAGGASAYLAWSAEL